MTSSYYLWKWADNDLPGKPTEVFSTLLQGELHPALRPFNARPVLHALKTFAACRREVGEEWTWEVQPSNDPAQARFIFLTGPHLNDSRDRAVSFWESMNGLEMSGYDEQYGHVIHVLRAKLNCFLFGQDHRERYYDLTPDELPPLLHRVKLLASNPFAIIEDRRGYFVQCYAHRHRFCVEWRENYDADTDDDFGHWRASLRGPNNVSTLHVRTKHATLQFADTLRVFQAFVRRDPKPSRYRWRSIKRELEQETERRKKGGAGTR